MSDEMTAAATLMHYVPAGGVGALLLKELWSSFKKAKEKAEDTTEETLKKILTTLEDVRQTLHSHDMAGVKTDARLENLEREVVQLRTARHEHGSTLSAVATREHLLAQRMEVLEQLMRELRGDTNPRGRTT